MLITCLDLEGVLVPEIWINIARKTGIEKLKLTTRDIPDYDELMRGRLEIVRDNKLTLQDIQKVIATMSPFEGAVEFLDWVRKQGQLVILSDTFVQFAKPLMMQLDMPTLFCHSLVIENDQIVAYKLRLKDAKRQAVKAFHGLNFKVIAAGDSFNDLSMLEEADAGFFFKPPASISERFPQYPVANEYSDLKKLMVEKIQELYT